MDKKNRFQTEILNRIAAAEPKRTKTSLYLDQDLLADFRERCEKRDVSMSKVLEALIQEFLGKAKD